ncbi:S-adenosyl-L-methionine-dependent methyltransferase [Poronia punctata]|nr:S-adenosyl-L-methionine-dependent methyltransferase [Poronia punctata]
MERPRSNVNDHSVRHTASARLSAYSRSDRFSSTGTSSGQGESAGATTASISDHSEMDALDAVPTQFWPRPDSDDDSDKGGEESALRRSVTATTPKSNTTAHKIRARLQKFGRSYDKRYDFLPNDAEEKDRNILQHNITLETLDGRLYLAPINNPRRVLDLGCGPGNWPLELARRSPSTKVVGVDIDKIRPPYYLPNCELKVADFNEKWDYGDKFDFIHLRHLGCLPNKEVIPSIYENLQPGGWAEFTEWIVVIQSTHNSFSETNFYKWNRYWKKGSSMVGKSVYFALKYKELLRDAGFRNITERKHAVPMNPWPPGRRLQKLGAMMATNTNRILEAMSMPIFTEVLGWTPEALRSFLTEVRKDLVDVRFHTFVTLVTIYAQKPRGEDSSTASPIRPG